MLLNLRLNAEEMFCRIIVEFIYRSGASHCAFLQDQKFLRHAAGKVDILLYKQN